MLGILSYPSESVGSLGEEGSSELEGWTLELSTFRHSRAAECNGGEMYKQQYTSE